MCPIQGVHGHALIFLWLIYSASLVNRNFYLITWQSPENKAFNNIIIICFRLSNFFSVYYIAHSGAMPPVILIPIAHASLRSIQMHGSPL